MTALERKLEMYGKSLQDIECAILHFEDDMYILYKGYNKEEMEEFLRLLEADEEKAGIILLRGHKSWINVQDDFLIWESVPKLPWCDREG